MTGEEFERLFQDCVRETGASYVSARDRLLLADDPQIVSELRERSSSGNWRSATTAEILVGWIDQRALFQQVTPAVQDRPERTGARWPGRAPATTGIARTLVVLGQAIVPRLVEILTKTQEYAAGYGLQIVLLALDHLRDRRAVQPLLALVQDENQGDELRILALATLGGIGDPRAFDTASALLTDVARSTTVRSTAALCLGRLGSSGAIDALMATTGPEQDMMLRRSAIRAVGYLGDASRVDALNDLMREPDEGLGLDLVYALSRLDARRPNGISAASDRPAVQALARAAETHPNSVVQRAAWDALGRPRR